MFDMPKLISKATIDAETLTVGICICEYKRLRDEMRTRLDATLEGEVLKHRDMQCFS